MEDLGDRLDVLGQQPGLFKLYTQLCLCYPVADASSYASIRNTLTAGLERLATSFPWVAGQVVTEHSEGGRPDVFKITPFEKIPRLVVKDLRQESSAPTMDDFRHANFPFSMLHESVVAPINTLAAGTDAPAPVFLIQANFIHGGLLLTFCTQHNTMDMTGHAQVMYLLSKACRNESFTSEELTTGNCDRRHLIPLLDESYQPGPELSRQIAKPPPAEISADNHPAPPATPPKCIWTYFTFSSTSLAALKSLATKSLTASTSYVSTDDVLSSFIWQGITRARLPRLDPRDETTFARAVDPRRYLGIAATYTGLVQNMVYNTLALETLINEPLGSVASQMRAEVDPKTSNLGFKTRALVTWLHRSSDKSSVNVTATLHLSSDIMLSSWAKYDSYELDFNLGLGKPEAVRRPAFVPVESLFYLMPKRPDGEIAVAMCLREEDLERLKADEEFMKYSTYVG